MKHRVKALLMALLLPLVVLSSCSKGEQGYATEGIAPGKSINLTKDNFQNYFVITGNLGEYYKKANQGSERIYAIYASITPNAIYSQSLVELNVDLEAKVKVFYSITYTDSQKIEYKTCDLTITAAKVDENNRVYGGNSTFENNDFLQLTSDSNIHHTLYNYTVEIVKASGTLKFSEDLECFDTAIKMENAKELFDLGDLNELGREQKEKELKIYYSIEVRSKGQLYGYDVIGFKKASLKINYQISFPRYKDGLVFKGDIDLRITAFGYGLRIIEIKINLDDTYTANSFASSISASLKEANGTVYLSSKLPLYNY